MWYFGMVDVSLILAIGSMRTTKLGDVWLAASARGLTTVEFHVSRPAFEETVRRQLGRGLQLDSDSHSPLLETAGCEVAEYLEGQRRKFSIPIDWSILTSDFQRSALRAVMAIPYGETRTYGQIAAKIGYPGAPRAVGRANATNPMPLVIPCHRVVGSDGKLHGYGGYGGLGTKQWLLNMESGRVAGVRTGRKS